MRKFIPLLFSFLLSLFPLSSLSSQELGLVLAGGGGKGAYEVGVWKAFVEYGLAQKVTYMSGTSVGGLNAGLFASECVDRVVGFWQVFVPEELWNNTYEVIDQKGLERIINQADLSKMQKNPYPKVFVTTTRARFLLGKFLTKILGFDYAHRFLLNEEPDLEEIKKMMLATSAVPLLTNSIELKDGYRHVDGGVADNVPISPLLDNEEISADLSTVFVVHLGQDSKLSDDYPDGKVVDIFPSEDIGSWGAMVDFSQEKVNYLIELGYRDACKVLSGQNLHPVEGYWFE